MKRFFISVVMVLCVCLLNVSHAMQKTIRIPEFSNDKVKVWKSVIFPTRQQELVMHRHDHDRVLVALDSGVLKIVDNKHQEHFLELKQEKAYFLPRDPVGLMHTDENVGKTVLKVMVVELI